MYIDMVKSHQHEIDYENKLKYITIYGNTKTVSSTLCGYTHIN